MAALASTAPIHLRPAAELADRVLLPGDPGRAMAVATALMDKPRMFNHARGLWGYTGVAADGLPLTVQATGIGGPSAAIVITELADLGARTLLRIGTCGALDPELALGDLLAARSVIAGDGASRALGATDRVEPDGALTEALVGAGARPADVVSTDLFYDAPDGAEGDWRAAGAAAVEMEAATLLTLAARRDLRAAVLLAVSDRLDPDGARTRIDAEGLDAAGLALGRMGLAALSATSVRR